MRSLIQSTSLERRESGEILSYIHVTHETNGCAVWFQRVGHEEQLLAWHHFTSRTTYDNVINSAKAHAHSIVAEADMHGVNFAEQRRFEQC